MKYLFAADRAVQAIRRIATASVVIYFMGVQLVERHRQRRRG